jgi:outer membrane protein OmpA-like peptidoglycan-associated protein
MALSKENLSSSSQLQGLMDLLMDLQIVDSTQESPSEESPSSNEEATSQDEALCSQLVEECQDSPTKGSPVLEAESKGEEERGREGEEERGREGEEEKIDQLGGNNPPAKNGNTSADIPIWQLVENFCRAGIGTPPLKPEEFTDPSILSEADFKQVENLATPPEALENLLIQSQLQEEEQLEESTSQSITATDNTELDDAITEFERLQRLLLTPELMDSREAVVNLKEKLHSLEHQIYEPQELINLLLPLMTEILSLKVAQAREEVASAIAPLVDEMIQVKTQQDKVAMSSALAPVLPAAVAQRVSNSPGEFAKALGPEMGTAIKEQISLERDAMVDALYPVIGSTISKYMAEAIKSINEKVENTLSLEGISRKIRAKIQGVSEAELILKEAMPFTVQAIFLIHKGSGLVIAEVQPLDRQHLESEMVAGMLTAIRSFANDCIAQSGNISELDKIDYGNSQITLEVAGYCYLAAVTQGQPPKSFTRKMRGALATIVQNHSKAIELFDGDPANVPEQVHQILQDLTKVSQTSTEEQKRKPPTALLLISLAVVSTISLSLGIYEYRSWINHRIETQTSLALESDPELSVYRLVVEANQKTLKLSGRLPNQYLRSKAEQIAKKVQPKLQINNAIIPVEVPADPVSAQAEVKRVTNILNQMDGAVITADYSEGQVTVKGAVLQEADARKITQAFQQIPGVQSVTNTVQLQPLAIASRIYFDQGSSEIKSTELSKVRQMGAFLEQYPNKHLKLVGHTDPKGTAQENQQLALERATKVRDVLVSQGADSKRLQVEGTTDPPLGVDDEQLPLLSRCVEFELIEP